ncbi:MAG TPA: phage tail sheath C-terminal domain-containing protein [Candidatus Cybelea sp.]|nr:phage tail sheath C-terminal domain-containing protein [Candidatus Cybelea sp.]
MSVTVSYPGVYVEEIPSGVHTITGVATSITAFVGGAQRGPVNDPVSVFSFGDFDRTFGGMTADLLPGTTVPLYSMAFAVNDFFLNGGSQAVIVRVVADAAALAAAAPAAAPAGKAAPAADAAAPAPAAPAPTPAGAAQIPLGATLTLAASSPGSWGNNLSATVDLKTRDQTNKNLFNLTVIETDPVSGQTVTTETFFNLSTAAQDPTYVASYLAQNSQLVVVNGVVGAAPAAGTYDATANSGNDGPPVTDAQLFGGNLQANKQGIYALDKTDIFNLLVIPPYKSPMATADLVPLIENCVAYCQAQRAFLLVDPPDAWDNSNPSLALTNFIESDFGKFHAASDAPSYAAIFYPRLQKPNPMMGNQIQVFPSSGTIAGIFARTDAQRGVWKAPAGIDATLAGVTGLTVSLNDGDNGLFNPLGINCLRTFPIIGSIVWGSRTLDGADVMASDYKYIPVRRFTLFLESSLYRGTQWCVFEPNDEPLWSQIRLNVGSFMQTLFLQGAFQGGSASQAYFVKCDSESTTQTDINNGIVNIVVGFAPLKPAEFVVLQIQQMAGQTQS